MSMVNAKTGCYIPTGYSCREWRTQMETMTAPGPMLFGTEY